MLKLYVWLVCTATLLIHQSAYAAAANNALETASEGVRSNILQGNWRIVFVAVCIMAAGFMFAVGKLAWYWCVAIIIGALLIAGAEIWAAWLFSLF